MRLGTNMDAILGLLGICGANCAEDRDADSKGRGGLVSLALLAILQPASSGPSCTNSDSVEGLACTGRAVNGPAFGLHLVTSARARVSLWVASALAESTTTCLAP